MSDFKKVILPIIRSPEQKRFQEATKEARIAEVREHQRLAKDMSLDELEARRIHFFDLWCWETGDHTHRVISEIYGMALDIRRLVMVQPMTGPVFPEEHSLNFKYKPTEPEDDA
jgi:hypothetical protein